MALTFTMMICTSPRPCKYFLEVAGYSLRVVLARVCTRGIIPTSCTITRQDPSSFRTSYTNSHFCRIAPFPQKSSAEPKSGLAMALESRTVRLRTLIARALFGDRS